MDTLSNCSCQSIIITYCCPLRRYIQQFIAQNLAALRQKNSFTRNFAITLSGSALSTVLGLMLTPVTSRIFPPAVYGQFSIYAAIITNLNFITTLTYPNAFLLPKSKKTFLDLVRLTVVTSVIICVLFAVGLAFGGEWLMRTLQVTSLGPWFYTLPFLLLVVSFSNILSTWYIRDKNFTKRVQTDLVSNVGGRAFTIAYGYFVQATVAGLLLGEFFNRIVNAVSLAAGSLRKDFGTLWRGASWKRIKQVAYQYRDFPFFSLPAVYVYIVSAQLPIFMMAPAFGAATVGLYAFSMSLLEMPVSILASAIAPVFQQKATEVYHKAPEKLAGITLSLYNRLLYIGLLPFGFISIYGDLAFKVVFGAKWELAGVVTAYLGYYYVFKLLSLGTGGIYIVLEKQRYALYGNVLLLITRFAALGVGIMSHDLNLTLLLFGVGSLIVTFGMDLQVLSMLKLPVWRIALRTIALVAITLLLFKLLRLGLATQFSFFAPMSVHF